MFTVIAIGSERRERRAGKGRRGLIGPLNLGAVQGSIVSIVAEEFGMGTVFDDAPVSHTSIQKK